MAKGSDHLVLTATPNRHRTAFNFKNFKHKNNNTAQKNRHERVLKTKKVLERFVALVLGRVFVPHLDVGGGKLGGIDVEGLWLQPELPHALVAPEFVQRFGGAPLHDRLAGARQRVAPAVRHGVGAEAVAFLLCLCYVQLYPLKVTPCLLR